MIRFAISVFLSVALVASASAASAHFKVVPGFKPPLLKPHHPIPWPKPKPPMPPVKPVAEAPKPLIQPRADGAMQNYVGPYVMGVTFCGATSLIVSSHIKGNIAGQGQLTYREAHKAFWNCAVPFLGGMMVDAAFDANPQWPNR